MATKRVNSHAYCYKKLSYSATSAKHSCKEAGSGNEIWLVPGAKCPGPGTRNDPGKRGHIVADKIVADTNVSLFTRARNFCCGHKFCVQDTKMFLILFRKIVCPQQIVPQFAQPKKHGNNVPATMCPRLPGP